MLLGRHCVRGCYWDKAEASLMGRSGGLHLGNVTMRMRVVEVMLWRDSMVRCCDELNEGE